MVRDAIQLQQKTSYILVRFSWGVPVSVKAYTDSQTPIVGTDGLTYEPMPSLAVEMPSQTALFGENPLKIELELDDFTDRVSNGDGFPRTSVAVFEVFDSLDPAKGREEIQLYEGYLIKAIRNLRGISNQIGLEAETIKEKMAIPLGIPAAENCVWQFGGRGCKVALGPITEVGTVSSVSGSSVTISGLSSPSDKYWHRGYLDVGGLRIGIRDWSLADPTTFKLVRQAPADWVGASVTAVPGCDKTIGTCRTRWNNEERYGGCGFAIPPHHPIFETSE